MSSESSSLPEQSSDDSTYFYFSHPDGLRVARTIVASLIQDSKNGNAQNQHDNFSLTSPPTFTSPSPEVASVLNVLLAFCEGAGPVQTSRAAANVPLCSNTNTKRGVMSDTRFPANRGSNHFDDIHPDPFAAFSSQSSHTGPGRSQNTILVPPFSTQTTMGNSKLCTSNTRTTSSSSQQMEHLEQMLPGSEGPSASRATSSPFHGTESPYNVESPSGRSSTFTPQPMSRQSSGRHMTMSNLPNPESEPLRLDSAMSDNRHPQASQGSNNTQTKLGGGGYFTPLSAMPPSTRHQPYSNSSSHLQSRTQQNLPSQIKNFLPVNKVPNNSKLAPQSKERSIAINNKAVSTFPSTSTLTLASSHNSPVAIVPHPGVNSPLFKAQNSMDAMEPPLTKKRKPKGEGKPRVKRQKPDMPKVKAKRIPKTKQKEEKAEKPILPYNIIMRIFEFSPPGFLKKARFVNKEWRGLVDGFTSLRVNQRLENYGADLPPASVLGLTEKQYTDLLGGKGCLEPGCNDELSSRTHWSWAKRWCSSCWSKKIEREDRIMKSRQHDLPNRTILTKLLECIPMGMYDSFNKAHNVVENLDGRAMTAPRIYKYYIKTEVDQIIEEYEAFKVPPFKDDPTKSAAENASARTEHAQRETEAAKKQTDFLEERKAKNDEHMARVLKIEGAIKKKRLEDAQQYNKLRDGRRNLFTKRAAEDLPHIPASFVQNTKAYKAATRIFRDSGTERGWRTLKPKIEKEWDNSAEKRRLESGECQSAEQDQEDASISIEQSQDVQFPKHASSIGGCYNSISFQSQVLAIQEAQNNRYNQFTAFGAQQASQTNIQNFMADRANNMMPSGGMFADPSSNHSYGIPTNNNYGRSTGPSLQSDMFLSNQFGNHFQGGLSQFHTQPSDMNHGLLQLPMALNPHFPNNAYMHHSQASNNHNNNFFGSDSGSARPGDRKITIGSLLANPSPDVAMRYGTYQ
ncbi:uncharacterized protein RAG0_01051 [Rhynchosporium agropyri]|uniref:F-box domain-containing protein n=1 Tax=Rhynchosporium agropyri TaxID=914238 RepID=A0A1E1JVC1_9HELO|nr:uncharacterized protein RAG0_01051 [Rhynchosporium agropyri]